MHVQQKNLWLNASFKRGKYFITGITALVMYILCT